MERFGGSRHVGRAALAGTLNAVMASSFTAGLDHGADAGHRGVGDAMFPPDALRAAVVAPLADARLNHRLRSRDPDRGPRELAALIEAFLAG